MTFAQYFGTIIIALMLKTKKISEVEIMKINAKTNLVARKVAKTAAFIALAIITVTMICCSIWPETISVNSDTAVIRLPGEFEGRAKVSYNAEYVTQERDNTTITLCFEKQGYYLVGIDNENYIFEVLNFDNSDYTVDMMSKELSNIQVSVVITIVLLSIGAVVVEFLVLSFANLYITSKISEYKKKERRVE